MIPIPEPGVDIPYTKSFEDGSTTILYSKIKIRVYPPRKDGRRKVVLFKKKQYDAKGEDKPLKVHDKALELKLELPGARKGIRLIYEHAHYPRNVSMTEEEWERLDKTLANNFGGLEEKVQTYQPTYR